MSRPTTVLATLAALLVCTGSVAAEIDWTKVDQAIGRKGSDQPGGLHKYSFPRSDLNVAVDGVTIKPALALGGWIAFLPSAGGAMFMGDLVLTDTEISPVMARLIADGVEITAVHNHLFRTSMPVLYMHVGGHGDPVKLAETLHAALAQSKTPLTPPNPPSGQPPPIDLDTASLDKALGHKGTINGGVYQLSVPRAEPVSAGGMVVPPSMGTSTAVNFQPTGGGKAAITGDFVMVASEVQPVLRALRQHGIEVTALHSHMIDDTPHLLFMHFWANDDAQKLARGVRAALDVMNRSVGKVPTAAPTNDPGHVVFVCEHGSVKSLIAALYFNQRAQQRGLQYTAIARGTSPDAAVPATVQQGLRAAGFDVAHYVPQPFKTSDVDGASLVVSFDRDTTMTVAGRVQELRWDNLPAVSADYALGRDEIVKHVDGLIDQLAR